VLKLQERKVWSPFVKNIAVIISPKKLKKIKGLKAVTYAFFP